MGDSLGVPIVDIDRLDAGSSGQFVTLRLHFSDDTVMDDVGGGYIELDTDQDPSTGRSPFWFQHDIGVDYFLDLFALDYFGFVFVYDENFRFVGNAPGEYIGQSIEIAVPLEMLGGDDGNMDVNVQVTNNIMSTDYAPDAGHGTIRRLWLTVDPAEGEVAPGSTVDLTASFDAFILDPGERTADIVIRNNDPDEDPTVVMATLTVPAPDIAVSPTSLALTLDRGASTTRVVTIGNNGTGTLVFDIPPVGDLLIPDPASGSVPPGLSLDVDIELTAADLDPGVHLLQIVINNNDPDEAPTIVTTTITVPAPAIMVTPGSFDQTLAFGQVSSDVLTISNTGTGTLAFKIGVMSAPPPEPMAAPQGAGEQDVFGYSWLDSDEPGGPAFNWMDISTTGIIIGSGDDTSFMIPIGFDFEFYGNVYDTAYVGTNGILGFDSERMSSLSNQLLPNTDLPNNIIAAFWDDLYVQSSDRLRYELFGNAPNRMLVVQWTGIWECCGPGASHTFQIILKERTGDVLVQFLSMGPTPAPQQADNHNTGDLLSATVGIEDASGTIGLTANYNTAYVHDGLAVLFTTGSTGVTVVPKAGLLPPGASIDLTVVFDSTRVPFGLNNSEIIVRSNDPAQPDTSVPVALQVDPPPYLICNGLVATIWGTAGPDNLIGTFGPDVIVGLGGNDWIQGRGGDDTICAGPGQDLVLGGPGDDWIAGDSGNDWIAAGGGDDWVYGRAGNDTIIGDGGVDHLYGGDGHDTIDGGGGPDFLSGGAGSDMLAGRGGDDMLTCGPGLDTANGGAGSDVSNPSCEVRVGIP